jgi:uncharacterized repeat protein (TIGR03803 family)
MQFTRHLRRLAALLPLVMVGLQAQPGVAAERIHEANVLPTISLYAVFEPEVYENPPRQVRSDPLLARDGNIYFGSATGGDGAGAIARLSPDNKLSTLYALKSDGKEGVSIFGPLVQGPAPDDNLYGTAYFGGGEGLGTLFRVSPLDGTFTVLYNFGGGKPNAALPYTGVVFGPDGYLYGTTLNGGARNKGTVYRIAPDGTDFSILHQFDGPDGENPEGTLVVGADGQLYGTTLVGGSDNRGVLYRISTSGSYEVLYSFPKLGSFNADGMPVNATGANPRAGLMLSADGNFYGTTAQGGPNGHGTLFRMTPEGQVSVVHAFGGPNHDGSTPLATVVQDELGNFYGTTLYGGFYHAGSVWRLTADGTFSLLHSFTGSYSEGQAPHAAVLLANGTLYAISYSDSGSANGYGAIIRLDTGNGGPLPVDLTISSRQITMGEQVTLNWTAPAGATCTKNLGNTDWKDEAGDSGSQTLTLLVPGPLMFALSCVDPDDGDENTPQVTRNAYVGVVVNAPLLQPVDGGAAGAGSLSLGWLLLAAALLCFKVKKEIRPSCP